MAPTAAVVQEKSAAHQVIESSAPLEEQIRARAHEIWLQRGGADGSEIEDWLQAEEEILRVQGVPFDGIRLVRLEGG